MFAVDAWLEGKLDTETAPSEPIAPAPDPAGYVHYWYGVYLTPKGKVAGFMVKRESSIPSAAIVVRDGVGCENVKLAMQTLVAMAGAVHSIPMPPPDADPEPMRPRGRPMVAGALATLSDGDGIHIGAIIDVMGAQDIAMVLLTSRPGWNPQARRASRDDLFALNSRSTRPTFIAPVVRDRAYVFLRDGELGRLRLADLRAEFDWEAAKRC